MIDVPGVELEVMEIARVERLLHRYPRVVNRLFTEAEASYCRPRRKSAQHFTARLAAKVAARRVLGGGLLKEFEVLRDDKGAPHLALTGHAAMLAGQSTWLLSLSHDAGVAAALVARNESSS